MPAEANLIVKTGMNNQTGIPQLHFGKAVYTTSEDALQQIYFNLNDALGLSCFKVGKQSGVK